MEVHVVHVAEPAEVLAQSRALALPAADADVDVVALGKDPRVAAGDDAELEHQPAAVARVERSVPLERDAVAVVAREREGPRRRAEGNAPLDTRYRGRLVLELGVDPGGYAWVFPKGDHVHVRVGGWASEGPRLREHLRRLCDVHDVDFGALTDVRGYRLPYRHAASRFASDKVL